MFAVLGWEVKWNGMEYNTMWYDILLIKIEAYSEIHKRIEHNKIKYNEIILLKDLCLDGKWTCNKNRIKLVFRTYFINEWFMEGMFMRDPFSRKISIP
jgi:hypothetical protein